MATKEYTRKDIVVTDFFCQFVKFYQGRSSLPSYMDVKYEGTDTNLVKVSIEFGWCKEKRLAEFLMIPKPVGIYINAEQSLIRVWKVPVRKNLDSPERFVVSLKDHPTVSYDYKFEKVEWE